MLANRKTLPIHQESIAYKPTGKPSRLTKWQRSRKRIGARHIPVTSLPLPPILVDKDKENLSFAHVEHTHY